MALSKREKEKARYLALHGSRFPDAEERWRKYENLVIFKFCPETLSSREEALAVAWRERDRWS